MTTLPPVLTLRDAPAVLEGLRLAFAQETEDTWQIDAAAVRQLDTSALAVLLECARIAAAGGRRLEITGVPPRLAELARLYDVDGLLGIAKAEPAGDAPPSLASASDPAPRAAGHAGLRAIDDASDASAR